MSEYTLQVINGELTIWEGPPESSKSILAEVDLADLFEVVALDEQGAVFSGILIKLPDEPS